MFIRSLCALGILVSGAAAQAGLSSSPSYVLRAQVTPNAGNASASASYSAKLVVGEAGGARRYPSGSSTGPASALSGSAHARTRSLAGSWAASANTVAVWRSPNRVTSNCEPGASKAGST